MNDFVGKKFGKLLVLGTAYKKPKHYNVKCDCGIEKIIYKSNLLRTFSCGCVKKVQIGRRMNLVGQRFGKLTVTSFAYIKKQKTWWHTNCDCGTQDKIVLGQSLNNGDTTACSRKCKYWKDLINQKFGDWTVIKYENKQSKGGNPLWLCRCKCGKENDVRSISLTTHHSRSCKSCSSFRGYEDITMDLYSRIAFGANKRHILFNVTIQNLWELFLKQNRQCSLTKLPLEISRSRETSKSNASLDRIDSSKGYTIDNVQWVHKDINRLKWTLSQPELISLCHKIKNPIAENVNPIVPFFHSKLWLGYGNISKTYFNNIYRNSINRHYLFDVTIEQLWDLYVQQKGCCVLTGMWLRFNTKTADTDGNISIDRIDSSKHYTLDNIQWINKTINFMKSNFSQQKFINYCILIANNYALN